jgi:ribonucleoside-diphosphate reductase beta chain
MTDKKQQRRHHTDHLAFFDDPVIIQRYDQVRHRFVEKFNDTQLSFFWRPEELDVTKDKADYESMNFAEQFIFRSNLQRQILLDTVQGREPIKAFLPIVSSPEMEAAVTIWSFSELIHSRSYTHIIRGVVNDPSEIFDEILDIPEITQLHEDLEKYYKTLDSLNFAKEANDRGLQVPYSTYEHKKAAYLAFVSVNALEAVRFFVSFACSFAMMELKDKMEGNAKIIKLISRDEQLHLSLVQGILNRIIKEDPEWQQVKEDCAEEAVDIFLKVAQQEKDWAKYLFQHGDMLGLNEQICSAYVDHITAKRMSAIGMNYPYDVPKSNPLPWMDNWISSAAKQTALQEAENDSYLLGAVNGTTEDVLEAMKSIDQQLGGV